MTLLFRRLLPLLSTARAFTTHTSFTQNLIQSYDAFILDQFGVLHDGSTSLKGAVACLQEMHKQGKRLVILSNTSAPSQAALQRLPKFGIEPNWFQAMITSGEEASKYVKTKYKNKKALFLTWDASDANNPRLTALPSVFLEHCGGITVAESVQDADFVLFHGSEVWFRGNEMPSLPLDFIETGCTDTVVDAILQDCVARQLSAVCANPDFCVRTPTGGTAYMPGKLAARYIELGGKCKIFGKPHAEHFEACVQAFGRIDRSRICHVGDSLHHDISGAQACGLDSIFCASSGIHANELQVEFGQLPSQEALEQLFKSQGIVPTHVVPAFRL